MATKQVTAEALTVICGTNAAAACDFEHLLCPSPTDAILPLGVSSCKQDEPC